MEENLEKQAQVMAVIEREQAAYKQAFGYREWRAACEVRGGPLHAPLCAHPGGAGPSGFRWPCLKP